MALIDSIDNLHTTSMGEERIRRNLALNKPDVIAWCKEKIINADIIIRKGKNWYVYIDGIVITVNSHSNTVITAHKTKVSVREITPADYPLLEDFIYHAIFVPAGTETPPRGIIYNPDVFIYIDRFGSKPGDCGVVAEVGGKVIGAAWERIIPAFGHVDDETPELAISVLPKYRGQAAGTLLMARLFGLLRESGFKKTSLAVQKENTAVKFYQRLGYITVRESVEEYIMVKDL